MKIDVSITRYAILVSVLIITDDYNSRTKIWGYKFTDARGDRLTHLYIG